MPNSSDANSSSTHCRRAAMTGQRHPLMSQHREPNPSAICPGPIDRREFLRIGLTGFATLSLPGLLQLPARAAAAESPERPAVILVWLRGGLSHLESYDPKPDAPAEIRGVYGTIPTNVP